MTESPLLKGYRKLFLVNANQAWPMHIPQEHFTDEAILVYWLFVFTLWHLGPHLGRESYVESIKLFTE